MSTTTVNKTSNHQKLDMEAGSPRGSRPCNPTSRSSVVANRLAHRPHREGTCRTSRFEERGPRRLERSGPRPNAPRWTNAPANEARYCPRTSTVTFFAVKPRPARPPLKRSYWGGGTAILPPTSATLAIPPADQTHESAPPPPPSSDFFEVERHPDGLTCSYRIRPLSIQRDVHHRDQGKRAVGFQASQKHGSSRGTGGAAFKFPARSPRPAGVSAAPSRESKCETLTRAWVSMAKRCRGRVAIPNGLSDEVGIPPTQRENWSPLTGHRVPSARGDWVKPNSQTEKASASSFPRRDSPRSSALEGSGQRQSGPPARLRRPSPSTARRRH